MEKINNSRNSILTKEQIQEFQEIYKKKFDIILTEQEAFNYWVTLLTFMKASLHKDKK